MLTEPIDREGWRTPLQLTHENRVVEVQCCRHTLACGIDNFNETHLIVNHELLSVSIFYGGVICLQTEEIVSLWLGKAIKCKSTLLFGNSHAKGRVQQASGYWDKRN